METRPAQSRLLLQLALALEDSRVSIPGQHGHATPPKTPSNSGWVVRNEDLTDEERADVITVAGWERLESLAALFEAELAYADACLDDDPPPSKMEVLLATSSELRRVAILQRFVERAYLLRLNNPRHGLEISTNLLAWTANPSPLVAIIRCRTLMERGNFLRILGDRDGAYAALNEASREMDLHGIVDPLELARHEELLGTLEAYCGNLERARRLLKKALNKVRRWGDNYTLQRVLISAGLVELNSAHHEQAETLLEEAMTTAEPDTLLLLCSATNRVLGYFDDGNPQLAYQALCGLRTRLGESWLEHLPPGLQMRQIWLEGQIRSALGMDEEAIGLLKKARESYIRADCGYEVCYTSVELALTYAKQRRFTELRHELAFALPFCSEEQEIDRFGKEAVQLLLNSLLRKNRVEIELIRAVALRLNRVHRAPLRKFDQSPMAELRS
jgi:tetratricopeptide (TPR) repeat protein